MLVDLYSSHTRARSINTRITLVTTKKLQLYVANYYSKMCHYADELTTTGAPLCDDEIVAYILAGLNEDYNVVFTAVVARTDHISPTELFAQLLSFEQHSALQAHNAPGGSSSSMVASRGCGHSGGHVSDCGHGHGRGCSLSSCGGFSNKNSKPSRSSNSGSRPHCQVYLKIGHTAN
jgi:hypothetical protein